MPSARRRTETVLWACAVLLLASCGEVEPQDAVDGGVEGAPAWLSPAEADFGVGCRPVDRTFCLHNPAEGPVAVSDLWIEQTGVGRCTASSDCEFAFAGVPDPLAQGGVVAVPAGGEVCVGVRWLARATGPVEARLVARVEGQADDPAATLRAEGEVGAWQEDTFQTAPLPQVDLLFVVDDSPAMAELEAHVADNLSAFMRYFPGSVRADWRIGVVTTDLTETGGRVPGRLEPQDAASAEARWIDAQTPDPEAALLARALGGGTGSDRPAGLEAMRRALSAPLLGDPAANGEFLREGAMLGVVFVTGSEDHSPDEVDAYLAFLRGLEAPAGVELMAALGGDGCGTAGPRYEALVRDLGGLLDALCSAWSTALVPAVVPRPSPSYALSTWPEPDSLSVTVSVADETYELLHAWTYRYDENVVVLDPQAAPPPGATLSMRYRQLCLGTGIAD